MAGILVFSSQHALLSSIEEGGECSWLKWQHTKPWIGYGLRERKGAESRNRRNMKSTNYEQPEKLQNLGREKEVAESKQPFNNFKLSQRRMVHPSRTCKQLIQEASRAGLYNCPQKAKKMHAKEPGAKK